MAQHPWGLHPPGTRGWRRHGGLSFPAPGTRISTSLPGAEMINEQQRRALKMKNTLTILGINHRIMRVP